MVNKSGWCFKILRAVLAYFYSQPPWSNASSYATVVGFFTTLFYSINQLVLFLRLSLVVRQMKVTEEILRNFVNLQTYTDLFIHRNGLHTAVELRDVERDLPLLTEMKKSTGQYVQPLNLE